MKFVDDDDDLSVFYSPYTVSLRTIMASALEKLCLRMLIILLCAAESHQDDSEIIAISDGQSNSFKSSRKYEPIQRGYDYGEDPADYETQEVNTYIPVFLPEKEKKKSKSSHFSNKSAFQAN